MIARYTCRCCDTVAYGSPIKVPGPSIGGAVVDILACHRCADEYDASMEKEFWKGASASAPDRCMKCDMKLTGQNSRHAYRKANAGGIPEVVLVCDSCHSAYRGCCGASIKTKGEDHGKDANV